MLFRNIFLIDDDDDDQEIFLTALEKISSEVKCTTYNNAKEALEFLKGSTQYPEVIFLDLNMPVMNGQQFLVEIKKTAKIKEIPVIIFTTSSHPATIMLMKDLGAIEFITKPNNFDDLVKVLKKFVG